MVASFPSSFVPEIDDRFLALFPHRWDFLYAEHCKPGETPDWQTETRHPLGDRQIQKGDRLYGVRFGPETAYFMLDIDRDSPYHPLRDRLAIPRLTQSLEMLGCTAFIACTSSYSGGIHLYFPLSEPVKSWELAAVVTQRLKQTGFLIEPGLLEAFPNERNYDPEKIVLFNGHRLPLQAGSYLLDKHLQFNYSSPESFCAQWEFCQWRNELNPVVFRRLLEDATRTHRSLSRKASKFIDDLNTDIDAGWTDQGQTNFLLGRITLRSYIFGGWLDGGEPLTGDRLVREIVKTAESLPGYRQHCRHQHEIWKRAEEWGRCAENSRYYPYRNGKPKPTEPAPTATVINWNQWRREKARARLCAVITEMIYYGTLPTGTTERFLVLTQQHHFSGETLYHHIDLWHPDLWKTPSDSPDLSNFGERDCSKGASRSPKAQSLLAEKTVNPTSDEGLGAFLDWAKEVTGRNRPSGEGFSNINLSEWWVDDGGGG